VIIFERALAMSLPRRLATAISATVLVGLSPNARGQNAPAAKAQTTEIAFTSHDGNPMRGKLTVPNTAGPCAVVVYAQAAEGMTVDMKRPLPGQTTSTSPADGGV
jgi:hypothetical protein